MNAPSSVENFFHGYALDFDAIYGNRNSLLNKYINRWLRRSMLLRFEGTMQGCSPIEGKSVIDIGCGPGHYAISLARRGASRVHGLDFAAGMLEVARRHAQQAGVAAKCEWTLEDFLAFPSTERYDYAICMGLMDYIADPIPFVAKVLGITNRRAFFSFPLDGGILAWQRQKRYKSRCPLFMYSAPQVEKIFSQVASGKVTLEKISRDLFVTVRQPGQE